MKYAGLVRTDQLQIRTIDSEASLASIAEPWRQLAAQQSNLLPTQCHEYFVAFREAFALAAPDFKLFACYRSGELVALLPTRFKRKSAFRIDIPILEFVNLPMPIRDILIAPEVSLSDVVNCLHVHLKDQWPWIYMHFKAVPNSSPLIKQTRGLTIRQEVCGMSNAIDVARGKHINEVLSANTRNNLKRKRKKLNRLGQVVFTTITEPEHLDAAFQAFLDTEAAGWKSVSGGRRAVKLHADQTAFYRKLMQLKSVRREVHIHLLYVDDVPIASDYCILTKGISFSLKHGYDEKYADMAPGNLLRAYTIEYYESDDSIHTLDLISNWRWHNRWRPTSRPIYDVKIIWPSTMARLLYRVEALRRTIGRYFR
jgi:CelD/BcsL family acetyltransferase involved in cellulose biosynthesis